MKRIILFALLTLMALTACNVVTGSGNVVTETRSVRDFDQVKLHGSGTVILTQGSEESLTVEADDNVMAHIETDVRGGTLFLGIEDGVIVNTQKPIVFYLTMIDIAEVSVSGSGDVIAENIESDYLAVDISGSGTVDVAAGTVQEQDVRISGSGDYEAPRLESDVSNVRVSGSGEAIVWANDSLDVRISGSGDVQYYGNPQLTQRISGSGDIDNLSGR